MSEPEVEIQIPEFGGFNARGFLKDEGGDVFAMAIEQEAGGPGWPGSIEIKFLLNATYGEATSLRYYIDSEKSLREAQFGLEGLIQGLTALQRTLATAKVTPWVPQDEGDDGE